MEIRHTTDGGLAVTFGSSNDSVSMGNIGEQPIISVKEARKLLGKELADTMSDIDLMGIIGLMSHLADSLFEAVSVPQNAMASV